MEQDTALIRPLQQIDAAHQGALSGAAETDDAKNIALLHGNGYILEGTDLAFTGAKGFAQGFEFNDSRQKITSLETKNALVPLRTRTEKP